MVETIAPVVHGNKKLRYWSAVALHSVAASLAGAAFGTCLAAIGHFTDAPWGGTGAWLIGALALAYAGRELFGAPLPLFDRKQQVPEWWRTFYSPHVAAALYGAGLGIGFMTFLRFGTYVVVSALALVSGDLVVGALLGASFGLSRGLTPLVSATSSDEEEAAAVVVRLERTAVSSRPRVANGLILVVVAATALLSAGA